MQLPKIARVAVEHAAYHFDKLYDYLLPAELENAVPGSRVTVSFGAGAARRMGLIVELGEAGSGGKLKPVATVEDETPALDEEGLMLLRYLKEQTFCTYFEALSALLPAGFGLKTAQAYRLNPAWEEQPVDSPDGRRIVEFLRRKRLPCPREELCEALGLRPGAPALTALAASGVLETVQQTKRRVGDERQTMVRLAPDGQIPPKPTVRQRAVIGLLEQVGEGSLKELCYFTGVTRAVVDRLRQAGIVEYFEIETYRDPYEGRRLPQESGEIALSPQQQEAFEGLRACKEGTALLYGVTGSGKTQVFLRLIEETLAGGRGVIVLVPEISLTPQTIGLFHRRFGRRVAVLHSGLSMSQRLDEWKRVRRGGADIVVGTRSAVFAPLKNLGLIVIDEEQEHTYRSESSPRYDAREVARLRCRRHKAPLLLASATPSVESFYRARRGEYKLVALGSRYGAARLPDVSIVDLKADLAADGFSQLLIDEIYHNLKAGEQTVLLLNRRGHSTQVKCMKCGAEALCPNCAVAMTYHTANGRLVCHYCGHSQSRLGACPACGSEFIRYSGLGTQRAEEELRELFPDGRILRMDTDTTMSRFSHERLLGDFGAGRYDIMIGTQMVAKGLDFPNVTLVGVLAADQMLYSDHFRGAERAFSLITQVVGRCGRAGKPGRAFIQTFTPDNPIIELAATQQYEAFYREEIGLRKIHLYPPFCRMCCIGFTGEDLGQVAAAAARLAARLAGEAALHPQMPMRLLGPVEAGILRVAGRYRYKLLVKCKNTPETRGFLAGLLAGFGKEKENRGVTMFIDPSYDGAL